MTAWRSHLRKLTRGGGLDTSLHPVLQLPWGSWRLRLLSVLVVLLLGTAVAVILNSHWNRKLFAELQGLEKQRDQLEVEWGQLLLEESTWSAHGRVELLARERLQMYVPDTKSIQMVQP